MTNRYLSPLLVQLWVIAIALFWCPMIIKAQYPSCDGSEYNTQLFNCSTGAPICSEVIFTPQGQADISATLFNCMSNISHPQAPPFYSSKPTIVKWEHKEGDYTATVFQQNRDLNIAGKTIERIFDYAVVDIKVVRNSSAILIRYGVPILILLVLAGITFSSLPCGGNDGYSAGRFISLHCYFQQRSPSRVHD